MNDSSPDPLAIAATDYVDSHRLAPDDSLAEYAVGFLAQAEGALCDALRDRGLL